jgi:hypothetical protein
MNTDPDDSALFGLVRWDRWVCWRMNRSGRWEACGGADDRAEAEQLRAERGGSRVLARGQRPELTWAGARPP